MSGTEVQNCIDLVNLNDFIRMWISSVSDIFRFEILSKIYWQRQCNLYVYTRCMVTYLCVLSQFKRVRFELLSKIYWQHQCNLYVYIRCMITYWCLLGRFELLSKIYWRSWCNQWSIYRELTIVGSTGSIWTSVQDILTTPV